MLVAFLAMVLFAVIPQTTATAGPACAAADPAMTDIKSKLVRRRGTDHYVITATVTNLGELAQGPGLVQHVVLLRGENELAPQSIPSLGSGVDYIVAFAIDRPPHDRKKPLALGVRYVLEAGDRTRNNCFSTDDTLAKIF